MRDEIDMIQMKYINFIITSFLLFEQWFQSSYVGDDIIERQEMLDELWDKIVDVDEEIGDDETDMIRYEIDFEV